MTDTLFHKSAILKNINIQNRNDILGIPTPAGLDITHRQMPNNEDYITMQGTKQQINDYLQEAPELSSRLRTLNNLPKFRIFNDVKVRIQ